MGSSSHKKPFLAILFFAELSMMILCFKLAPYSYAQTTTPTPSPGALSSTPNTIPTGSPTLVPTNTDTMLSFTLLLHGVGSSGDNPNPGGAALSNKTPLHPQRTLEVQVFDTHNQQVANATGSLLYNGGAFTGTVNIGSFGTGSYLVKVKTDRYLRKLVPNVQIITASQANSISQTELVTGDTNNDNLLNILDYNALLDCGYGAVNPLPIIDPRSTFNSKACQAHNSPGNVDLNDDGVIDSIDYNLFVRELSVQSGD